MATLKCMFCKTPQKAERGIRAVLCGSCTARLAGTPEQIGKVPASAKKVSKPRKKRGTAPTVKKATTGYGRGWHLKKNFTAPDGKRYSFGKLISK